MMTEVPFPNKPRMIECFIIRLGKTGNRFGKETKENAAVKKGLENNCLNKNVT